MRNEKNFFGSSGCEAWLGYPEEAGSEPSKYVALCSSVCVRGADPLLRMAKFELVRMLKRVTGKIPRTVDQPVSNGMIVLQSLDNSPLTGSLLTEDQKNET